jgi:hypothetical protein
MKAAAIGIAGNGQHAGSQRGTLPETRRAVENRQGAANAAVETAGAEMAARSMGPAAADWSATETEVAEAAMLAE